MTTGPDESTHGREYPPSESAQAPVDPHAPVDYPTDPGSAPPNFGGPPNFPQSGYPPPQYPPAGYPPPGYPPPAPQGNYSPQYPGAYGYGYQPYGQAPASGTNGKAIAALITSIAGLLFCGAPSIVGVVLGIIAMRETKRTGQDGYGMALAAVIVGAIVTAIFVIGVIVYAIGLIAIINDPNTTF